MSFIAGLPPSALNSPPPPQVIASEAAEQARTARSAPTPDAPAPVEENQPVTASNPTRENANAANSDVSTGATPPSEPPARPVRSFVDADPQSVVMALSDDQNAAPVRDDDQARQLAEAAQAAYAQQAAIDRLSDKRPEPVKIAEPSRVDDSPVDRGPSLADLGEMAAAEAEDPLAA